ncbi:hypothetical protein E0Z10_g1792 [Xylaria hypoxylon]|uniref:Velvet domain-containing protein n=1 Tax=Xylaria hypoxylon TaxID=37992 RepID=A0A4Z0ZBT6_9PEZI|nr:hypothetical protein E0Z10_g1792 [Xylaria hypoxylon]
MASGYPAPPVYHHQPDMAGPPPQHSGYAPLPPPMPSNNYYQDPMANPHRPNMPPPRANMMPPSIPGPGPGPGPGPRDRVAELGASENGLGSQPPTQNTTQPEAEETSSVNLEPREGSDGARKYRLEVVQQPLRARMCGFGDKDRRPITPPPCIRLVVMDKGNGKEVDCNEVEHQHYVLHVDLWSEDGAKEVNLVKHSQQSPSISSTHPSSFREVVEGGQAGVYGFQAIVPSNRDFTQPPNAPYPHQMAPYQPDPYSQGQYSYTQQVPPYGYPQGGYRDMAGVAPLPSQAMYGPRYSHDMSAGAMAQGRLMGQQQPNSGMYTRNLIGSLAASASRLQDPSDKIGIWFILQDLSVRTEGWFRLRFSFINLRRLGAASNGGSDAELLNRGRAPVLAYAFSEKFQVYSAKKFPGVCESTQLSKTFALQGVKIPIRKDQEGKAGKGGRGSDDEEE